jgi:hypothetical protein
MTATGAAGVTALAGLGGVGGGAHTLTAEDPLPPDLRDALAQIN